MSLLNTHHEETDEEDNQSDNPTQLNGDDVAFVAKLRSSRTLASILKTIDFADVNFHQMYNKTNL